MVLGGANCSDIVGKLGMFLLIFPCIVELKLLCNLEMKLPTNLALKMPEMSKHTSQAQTSVCARTVGGATMQAMRHRGAGCPRHLGAKIETIPTCVHTSESQ